MAGPGIQSFIDSVAVKAGIDPSAAETIVGTILSVIQQEGDPQKVAQIFARLPGAAELASKHVVVEGSGGGGLLGSLSGIAEKLVGGRVGILLAAIAQIESTNVSVAQLKNVGTALIAYVTENTDPAIAKEVFDAIPGLREHFSH
jgi:hypothetical protein